MKNTPKNYCSVNVRIVHNFFSLSQPQLFREPQSENSYLIWVLSTRRETQLLSQQPVIKREAMSSLAFRFSFVHFASLVLQNLVITNNQLAWSSEPQFILLAVGRVCFRFIVKGIFCVCSYYEILPSEFVFAELNIAFHFTAPFGKVCGKHRQSPLLKQDHVLLFSCNEMLRDEALTSGHGR